MKKVLIISIAIAAVFAIAIISFAIFRTAYGAPWTIKFNSQDGMPVVLISCNKPLIPEAEITFSTVSVSQELNETIIFSSNKTNVPIGKITFIDTTLLPGNVTLELFNHKIAILRRNLIIDGKEYEWKQGLKITI